MFDARKLLEAFTGASQSMQPNANQRGSGDNPLGDIFGQLGKVIQGQPEQGQQRYGRQEESSQGQGGQQGGGGLMDVLGQVLGQATQGVREGAGRINDATGIGSRADDAMRQATGGRGAADMVEQLKDLVANNKGSSAAVLGGLAAVLLGTQTGRSALGTAAKLGGAALIGGLAYKAYQNYQAGRPLISGTDPVAPAPRGSGFEADAVSDNAAVTYLRAMIAAATADGQVDQNEARRISGAFQQAGLGDEAARFLEQEYRQPASPDDLAAASEGPEMAMQIYTAARITIDPEQENNRMFLDALAERLGIDSDLAAHIDAQAAHQG
jgi:uncharacterized membrane protein YebE (DUF533 family)